MSANFWASVQFPPVLCPGIPYVCSVICLKHWGNFCVLATSTELCGHESLVWDTEVGNFTGYPERVTCFGSDEWSLSPSSWAPWALRPIWLSDLEARTPHPHPPRAGAPTPAVERVLLLRGEPCSLSIHNSDRRSGFSYVACLWMFSINKNL